jgi:hypothetical protein
MELISNNVYLFGLLFVFLGWITNHARVLAQLSKVKERLITPVWYIQNRPYKFVSSITLTLMGIVINILTFDPASITDGLIMVSYLGSMAASGFIADNLIDKIGRNQYHKINGTEPDDGKTRGNW